MKIDLYLTNCKNLNKNSYLSRDSIDLRMMGVFKDISVSTINSELMIEPISSSSVYPEILTDGEKYYLLWDLCYFKLFDRFLYELGAWKDRDNRKLIDNIVLLLHDYLIYKLDSTPELSLILKQRKDELNNYSNSMIHSIETTVRERYMSKSAISIGLQVRFLTFYHELQHVFYKQNRNELKKDLIKFGEMIERHLIKGDSLSGRLAGLGQLDLNIINSKEIEELACDEYALEKTERIFVALMEREYGVERSSCFNYVRESYWINKAFFSYLTVLSDIYRKLYHQVISHNYKVNKEEIYAPLIMRFETIPHGFLQFHGNQNINITAIQAILMVAMNRLTEDCYLKGVFEDAKELAANYDNPLKLKSMLNDMDKM